MQLGLEGFLPRPLGEVSVSRRKDPRNQETFRELTPAQREELAKDAEVELKAGLALLSRDKQMIRELLEIAEDPPPAQ